MFKKAEKTNGAAKFREVERIKLFETPRDMWLVMQDGHVIANIRVHSGSDESDVWDRVLYRQTVCAKIVLITLRRNFSEIDFKQFSRHA